MDNESIIVVDVREDLAMKKEPFDKIMRAIKQIKVGQTMELHAPFNTIPLHPILKRKGFEHTSEKIERKHWKMMYTRKEMPKK
ncbi:MAG TPA: DUF2249 domain-containing protein [Bacillota bacterium]|nr:DUF2249 domain-containing protein [Bacillota bacterium]